MNKSKNKLAAFTLAEVLITLGVIGVVAALTIAPVVHKYKIKQLKTAFIKMDANIQNALMATRIEYGYNTTKDINNICRQSGFSNQNYKDMTLFFTSQFNVVKKINGSWSMKYKNPNGNNVRYTADMYGVMAGTQSYNSPVGGIYILKDGSSVSSVTYCCHGTWDGISLTFDTNGPYKGPNRAGYDIFLYNTGSWQMGANNCNFVNDGSYVYRSCYWYAKKDQNPADSTKGYWESLK